MDEKLYNIISDDLGTIGSSIEKIRATAISAHSYLDNSFLDGIFEADEATKHFTKNQVLCMFRVIEDLTNITDDQLDVVIDKLCKFRRETRKETGASICVNGIACCPYDSKTQ